MVFTLLPIFNEKENILLLIERIMCLPIEIKIIAVNDGSTDGTKEILEQIKDRITIITHSCNKGLGEAIKTGLLHIIKLSNESDIVITMDSDNTHDPKLILDIIEEINRGYDIVIASRFKTGGKEIGVPLVRRFLSHSASFIFKRLFPVNQVSDYTIGYRGYKTKIIKMMFDKYGEKFIESKGFTINIELLLKSMAFSPKISEVPLILEYNKKKGKSKIKIMKTIFQYFSIIYRFYSHI